MRKKILKKIRNDTLLLYKFNYIKILYIIKNLSKNHNKILNQKNINLTLNIPTSTLSDRIKKLKIEDMINKNLTLTNKGLYLIRKFNHWDKTRNEKLRAHKIQVKINLSQMHKDFFKYKHKLLSPFTNKRYNGLKGNILNSKILFYNSKKLIVKIPDVYADNFETIQMQIIETIEILIKVIQMEFKGIKIEDYEICKFNSMHIAILNSTIAKSFLISKKCCFQGNNGFCIDGSKKGYELELEKYTKISENIDTLIKTENLINENKKLKKIIKNSNKK